MHSKNKKLEKLGITISSNQASPGTSVECDTTTRKSIVNLSDCTLQLDKIEALSQGLNFCPTIKMDPLGLTADTVEFTWRNRLREFFHKPQGVSSEPNETTNETVDREICGAATEEEWNWSPPEGRCPMLNVYAQAIRRCVNATFISHTHK
eukprot:g21965.t1